MNASLYDVTPPHGRWMLSRLITLTPLMCAAAAVVVELVLQIAAGGTATGYVCILAAGAGVVLFMLARGRWLALALVVLSAAVAAVYADGLAGLWTVAVFCIFVFAIRGRGALLAAIVAASMLYFALVAHEGRQFAAPVALVASTLSLAAAASGSSIRLQRDAWRTAETRLAEAAAAREARFDRALVEERLRIARDLHDTVGHEIAVVSINVGAAEMAMTHDPDRALSSLQAAREAAQRTLNETQQILRLLRDSAEGEAADRAEPARLEHIASLTQRMRDTGIDVHATIELTIESTEPEVSVAAYRIVQEALTNAQRHGEGTVWLEVSTPAESIHIRVRNRLGGPPRSQLGPGYGLVGLRERAASVGGRAEAAEADGWFVVDARLPAGGAAS